MSASSTLPAPTAVRGRAPAPDLARGVMLLLIALAHAPAYLHGIPAGPGGYPDTGSVLDRAVAGLETALVTGRAYPLFALLLGYGLARQASRQTDARDARRLIRRRGWMLLVLGFAHAALLWGGDILGAYGVLTVLLAGVVTRVKDRWIAVSAAFSILIVAFGGIASGGPDAAAIGSTQVTDPLEAAGLRLVEWAPSLALQPLGLLGAVMIGVWAARHRILEEPDRHRRLLVRAGTAGPLITALGGVPLALMTAGLWAAPSSLAGSVAGALHGVTGYGGMGYAALIALAVSRRPRPGRVGTAIAACGQRSLSCYLAQSIAFVALLAPYGGGLGNGTGVAASAFVAVAVWTLTVAWSEAMRRHDRRGPAEVVLRHFTYRAG